MNNKDIKNRIKQEALQDIPDVLHKIDLNSIEIEPEQVKQTVGIHMNLKLAFTAFILIITAFLSFQLFNLTDSTYPLDSDIEVLGFETVSAQALLEYSQIEEIDLGFELSMTSQSEASDTEDYINEMTPMIELAELIINNRDNVTYEEFDSELETYQKRIHFSASNLNGDVIEYDIYYSQTNGNITGKIVNGDFEYDFTKNNQYLRLYENETDFIQVENMKSDEIQEFTYRYVRNQIEEFSTSIRMEVQNDHYQAEFNYENRNGIKIALMMRRQNQSTMDVDYEIEDRMKRMNGRFNVDVQNDEMTGKMMYRFIFGDSSTTEKEKSNRSNQNPPGNSPNNGPSQQNYLNI